MPLPEESDFWHARCRFPQALFGSIYDSSPAVYTPLSSLSNHTCRLSHFGIHVIGTTSTEEKAKLAKENGAEHVIIYSKDTLDDVVKQVKALTPDGEGVHAVLDGVGKDTWESDFEVIRRKGMLVTFGNASGPVEPFAPLKLAAKNLKGKFSTVTS
jgi:NADPH:quinone reductase-like Zn-dependent oxidoreductase